MRAQNIVKWAALLEVRWIVHDTWHDVRFISMNAIPRPTQYQHWGEAPIRYLVPSVKTTRCGVLDGWTSFFSIDEEDAMASRGVDLKAPMKL